MKKPKTDAGSVSFILCFTCKYKQSKYEAPRTTSDLKPHPIQVRCRSGHFAEKPREVTLMTEAASQADFDERQFTVTQKRFSPFDSKLDQVLMRCQPVDSFEQADEMKF